MTSDVEAIRRVQALYCQLMDDREYDAWSQLFAADGIWALGGHEYRGPAETKAFMDRLLEAQPDRRSKHLGTNAEIVLNGDSATAVSDFMMLTRYTGTPWGVLTGGRYEDRFVRGSDGVWRFQERRLTH
jgi:3-phenylpropionate/cinnamic acid dioxygenase small subunit